VFWPKPRLGARPLSGTSSPEARPLRNRAHRGGSPCYRNPTNTLTVSRVPFCENPLHTNRVRFREWIAVAPHHPSARYFVAAGSEARRRPDPCGTALIEAARHATGIQPTRSPSLAYLFVRIPCARTGCAFAERIAVAPPHPPPRYFVAAGSEACRRADPCGTAPIEAARHATGIQLTHSPPRVPFWANPLHTRGGFRQVRSEWITRKSNLDAFVEPLTKGYATETDRGDADSHRSSVVIRCRDLPRV
jgi:hypothetical protein